MLTRGDASRGNIGGGVDQMLAALCEVHPTDVAYVKLMAQATAELEAFGVASSRMVDCYDDGLAVAAARYARIANGHLTVLGTLHTQLALAFDAMPHKSVHPGDRHKTNQPTPPTTRSGTLPDGRD